MANILATPEKQFNSRPAIRLLIRTEIPRISKDDIKLCLSGATLTISVEQKSEKQNEIKEQDKDGGWHPRCYFPRSVELPYKVKADDAQVFVKDGILEIRFLKTKGTTRG